MEHEELLPLLLGVADQDNTAFEKLYDKTKAQLYAVALKMLQRQELAEEALQEAYVKIWYNASSYQETHGTVLTWMVSIVRYRALDLIRYANVRKEQALDDESHSLLLAPEGDAIESDIKLKKCLNELENAQLQAIHLAFFNGFSHAEVVGAMGKPLGTVKSWIRRGLASLKRCLAL